MAGHTHGGQTALEFISPEIAPSRLVTPYVAGLVPETRRAALRESWHRHHSNSHSHRSPPEITIYELTRG